jgi:hypothetical protein
VTRAAASGQALVEYLVGCASLAVLLFVPVAGGRPAIAWIALALRDLVHGYGFLLSLT